MMLIPNALGNSDKNNMMVLPPGRKNPVREVKRITRGKICVIAVTQTAQVRRLYFNFDNHIKAYMLAIPDVVFVAVFYNGQIDCRNVFFFYASGPVKSMSDMLLCPGLPNIHSDLRICLGNPEIDLNQSMEHQLSGVVDYFWRSKFNSDLKSNHYEPAQLLHPGLKSPQIWAIATRKNRNFILRVPWKPAFALDRAMDNVMKKLLSSEGS